MSLKYEPVSEPLHISVKYLGRAVLAEEDEHVGDVREDLEERVVHEDRERRLRTKKWFYSTTANEALTLCASLNSRRESNKEEEEDNICTQPLTNEEIF